MPGEGEREAESLIQPLAQPAVAPQREQQQIAHHHRRQNQRQMQQAIEQRLAAKFVTRQQPGDGDAGDQDPADSAAGDLQAEHDRLPFGVGERHRLN